MAANDMLTATEQQPAAANAVLVKKAYEVNMDKIFEGFLYGTIYCHADDRNDARRILALKTRHDNLSLRFSDEPLSYMTIPVKRRESNDLVLFEGKEMERNAVDHILEKRRHVARLDEILADATITHCYIIKGYYYRPEYRGYTSRRSEAGVYPKLDAVAHARGIPEIRIEPIVTEEHNGMITAVIDDLRQRLIPT